MLHEDPNHACHVILRLTMGAVAFTPPLRSAEKSLAEAKFTVVGFMLPFQCVIGAPLARRVGLCFERFQMPSSARIEFLQRGTAKREYIYQDTASSTKGSQSIRYSIEQMCLGRVSPGATWELPTYYVTLDDAPSLRRFVMQEFEQIESVRDIVTLTGDLPNVWAAICQEYTSWRWPLISECVLELIDTIIKGPHSALKEFDRALRTNPDHTLLTPGASRVEFYVFGGRRIRINGDPLILADVLEALSWFTAALRTSRSTSTRSICGGDLEG